jgi:Ca2+-binding RTX toxin-like protein
MSSASRIFKALRLPTALRTASPWTDSNFSLSSNSITIAGGNAGNTVDFSALSGSNRVTFVGGAGRDTVKHSAAGLVASDVISGRSGADALVMTSAGTVHADHVPGVETYILANGGANTLTLANANFAGATGPSISIDGGSAGNTVNAAALTGANRVVVVGGAGKDVFTGGAGKDVFTGGAGNDVFKFGAANLASADSVKGGAGSDELALTYAGGRTAMTGKAGRNEFVLAAPGPTRSPISRPRRRTGSRSAMPGSSSASPAPR